VNPLPKTRLHQKLHITSLDKLREATAKHRLRKLQGFGAKTEEKILQALEGLGPEGGRNFRYHRSLQLAMVGGSANLHAQWGCGRPLSCYPHLNHATWFNSG
jgi:hypothetical protein